MFGYKEQRPIFNSEMNATITVFKNEFKNNPGLLDDISAMSSEIKEIDDSYAFSPRPGKLYELLNCLRENGLNYQTVFSV